MTLIPLTNSDKCATVDKDMVEYLSQWKWKLFCGKYVARCFRDSDTKQYKVIFMHRLVNDTPKSLVTDHINGDKLDNRRNNLRDATPTINQRNRTINSNNTSGITGVWYNENHGSAGAWVFNRRVDGVSKSSMIGCLRRGHENAKELAIQYRKEHELKYNITPRGSL